MPFCHPGGIHLTIGGDRAGAVRSIVIHRRAGLPASRSLDTHCSGSSWMRVKSTVPSKWSIRCWPVGSVLSTWKGPANVSELWSYPRVPRTLYLPTTAPWPSERSSTNVEANWSDPIFPQTPIPGDGQGFAPKSAFIVIPSFVKLARLMIGESVVQGIDEPGQMYTNQEPTGDFSSA